VHRLGAHVQLTDRLITDQRARAQASATPVDRDALAAHLRDAWPEDAAAAVIRCPAWPTLAEKLATAHHDGHDLRALLSGVNTSGLPTARKPAALASWILDQTTTHGVSDGGHGRAPEPTRASHHPDHDDILSWVDQLDPTSMIDRVGALGALSYRDTGIDTHLMTRFPDLLDNDAHGAGDAAAAENLAADRERSAAAHLASIDDPTTPQREDHDGQALAGRDLHEAAAAHATAAHNHATADTAVARANPTLTAPNPTTSQATPQVTPPPRPRPGPPTRTPRRIR
jgi:hypothetical protein